MRVHTSNKELVEKILNENVIDNGFWSYTLNYKVRQGYSDEKPLDNEHTFNLPEFKWSEWLQNRYTFDVDLNNKKERDFFFKIFDLKPTINSYIHYELDPHPLENYEYEYTYKIQPKYPIYVITKGRWERTLTINTLEDMGVDFKICVEPDEYDNYISNPNVDKNKVIKLPENFSERKQGGIPVRNFVWQHSIDRGFKKHWIIDDNIDGFFRWNNNLQKRIKDGVFFRIMEDFSDRYENIGLTSCQYFSFVPSIDSGRDMFIVNTRTYSCILINTELLDQRLEERWRGTYNEDTDLTLRVLSTGDLCTVNFNSLLSGKQPTGSMKGGNTTTIYEFGKDEKFSGLQKKFDELKENWKHIVKFTDKRHKDGRPHHTIPYTRLFKQKLKLKEGVDTTPKINEYNMKLVKPNNTIPKRFIRIWLGDNPIPEIFEEWWNDFKTIHPDYEFVTIKSFDGIEMSDKIKELLKQVNSYAGQSDILRLLVLYQMGGIYVDTDIKPIKSFDSLLEDGRPFLGKRSKVSFESAVIGSPKEHPSFKLLLEKLPEWFEKHQDRSASVQTGPAFVSSVLFGREDVRHLPIKTFYPFNGFGAPKRDEKLKMFETNDFPEEMICAHFSNHRWGGNPNKK